MGSFYLQAGTICVEALKSFPVREILGHALPENFEILYSCRYIFLHSEEHFKVALLYIDKMFLLACWTTSG